MVVKAIFDYLAAINRDGTTTLLVEQNVARALALCQRAYVLENGTVALAGSRAELQRAHQAGVPGPLIPPRAKTCAKSAR